MTESMKKLYIAPLTEVYRLHHQTLLDDVSVPADKDREIDYESDIGW